MEQRREAYSHGQGFVLILRSAGGVGHDQTKHGEPRAAWTQVCKEAARAVIHTRAGDDVVRKSECNLGDNSKNQ